MLYLKTKTKKIKNTKNNFILKNQSNPIIIIREFQNLYYSTPPKTFKILFFVRFSCCGSAVMDVERGNTVDTDAEYRDLKKIAASFSFKDEHTPNSCKNRHDQQSLDFTR